jgi:NTE family protein
MEVEESGVLSTGPTKRIRTFARQRIATHSTEEMRAILDRFVPVPRFEDLAVRFECVAASIERAAEQWFGSGPLVEAILASAAVPMLFPPVEIDGESYYDGGLVNSVPVDRAVGLGATRVFVLQVGRIEQPLRPPRKSYEPALIAFEIARRHRYAHAIERLPEGVELHLLPSGNPLSFDDSRQLRWRDTTETSRLIDGAREAAAAYLAEARL